MSRRPAYRTHRLVDLTLIGWQVKNGKEKHVNIVQKNQYKYKRNSPANVSELHPCTFAGAITANTSEDAASNNMLFHPKMDEVDGSDLV